MVDTDQKGSALMREAEKKLKSSSGFFRQMFGSASSNQEEAAELYVRAANSFKMSKKWSDAGLAFSEAAKLQLRLGSKHEAASCYSDAANCYRKSDANEAVNCLMKAIEILTDGGKFSAAAKHHVTIAEIYEAELSDLEKAELHYETAADYYKGEESTSHANKCLAKVAQFASQMERYDKAAGIYEQIGTLNMDNSLLKYAAKDHFYRAGLCHLCVDTVNGAQAIQKYEEMFPAFGDSRECKLLKQLVKFLEAQSLDEFTAAMQEYDSIKRLDKWETTMLLRIKKQIDDDSDLR